MEIIDAKEEDLQIINELAHSVWYDTYSDILSSDQIEYMLDKMYSIKSLKCQMIECGHKFLLVKDGGRCLAYASYEVDHVKGATTKLHKIYILPSEQGKGIGRQLIDHIEKRTIDARNKTLSLNVNKYNVAVKFYQSMGFSLAKEELLDIGNGFFMDDFIMEKIIREE